MSKKLEDIHAKYKTDKGTDHSYIHEYDELFKPYQKKQPINLLEIGVFHGESLKMFHEYFDHPNSTIYGIDDYSQLQQMGIDKSYDYIKGQLSVSCPRVNLIQADSKTHRLPFDRLYDIIIDDGDHTVGGQIETLKNNLFNLKHTGVYVIEDVAGPPAAMAIANAIFASIPEQFLKVELKVYQKNNREDDCLVVLRWDTEKLQPSR